MEIAKEDFIRFCKEYIEINKEIQIEKKRQQIILAEFIDDINRIIEKDDKIKPNE